MRAGDVTKQRGQIVKLIDRVEQQGRQPQEIRRDTMPAMGAAIVLESNANGSGCTCKIEALSRGNKTGLQATGECYSSLLEPGAVVLYHRADDGSIELFSGGATTINQTSQSIVKTYPGGIWYFGPTVP